MIFKLKKFLHRLGFHWWSGNGIMPSNTKHPYFDSLVKQGIFSNEGKKHAYSPELWEDWQKFTYSKCWLCNKERPYSRYFFNIGVKEKNANQNLIKT